MPVGALRLIVYFTLLICLHARIALSNQDSLESLRIKSAEGAAALRDAFLRDSRWSFVQQLYQQMLQARDFTLKRTTAADEVQSLANKLNLIVARKMSALKEAVRLAENVVTRYTINPAIEERHVSYISAKNLTEVNPRMEYNRMFLQKVVMNESSVHIPTDLFNGDVGVLNEIVWSSQLDRIFSQNRRNDPELLWQYFGSQKGIFRIFPGMRWRSPKNALDMYDVRRRPWYTQGSSSAKDILFLIDTSGSMHGQSLTLTKKSVKSLIDTLGENDFIAVAQYPGKQVNPDHTAKPHLIEDREAVKTGGNRTCFKSFIQATKRNKDRMFSQISDLEAYGIVNFTDVIDFAYTQFELFYNSSVNNQGAMCNSIIMILTDGDVSGDIESAKRLISQWRIRSTYLDKIRIFTYSVGQHQNPTDPLREVACENRGFFAEIPAMGAVTHQAHHVTTVLSRPMSLFSADFFLWHNIYLDSLGLGLMTSITLPLYNTSGNQSFLGLIGTDVTVRELHAMVPFHKFGPNGYAFAINANGYIVFHPELKAQNGWLRDPPNVDLIEVEFDSEEKRRVRSQIIETTGQGSNKTGLLQETIGTFLKISDDAHTHWAERTYAFTNVKETAFAISVVLPPSGNTFAVFNQAIKVGFKSVGRILPIARPENSTLGADHKERIEVEVSRSGDNPNWRRVIRYPSNGYDYLVPTRMPYCKEYYIPPQQLLQTTLQPHATFSPDPLLPQALPQQARRPWGTTTAAPTVQPHVHYENDGVEEPELIRNSPADMRNLLQTFLYNDTICEDHWRKAVAMDMTLYEDFFTQVTELAEADFSSEHRAVKSVFVTGLGGVMGVLPAGEARRYKSWEDGWFEGYYQRAFERPDVIFASIVPVKTGEIFEAMATTADPISASVAFAAFSTEATGFSATTVTATPGVDLLTGCQQCKSQQKHLPQFEEPPPVTMYQAVTLQNEFKVAVVGATLSWRWISETFFNSTFGSLCNPHMANNTCYLLEDGGYIVSANENFQVIGHFLGHVDKPLMRHLIFNLSIFGSEQEYDYQGSCPKPTTKRASKSGSRSVSTISTFLLTVPPVVALSMRSPAALLHSTLLWLAAPSYGQEATSSVNQNVSCIKLGYRYYRNPQAAETFQSLDSLGRSVTVLFLEGTNLVLSAVSKPPLPLSHDLLTSATATAEASGRLDFDELRREPREDPGPDVCSQESRFRNRPTSCYNWHPMEDTSECGRSLQHQASLMATTTAVLGTLLAFIFA